MGDSIGSMLGGQAPGLQEKKGAMFQPFGYTSLAGTAKGSIDEKTGEYTFSQELSPELQALYQFGAQQAQPFLSQYLTQAQQPVDRFQFDQGIQDRTAQYFAEQQAMLDPVFQEQRTQLKSDLFGSGRLGLQLGGVQPEAAGLAEAQAQALINSAMQARQMAQGEQAQMFGQALQGYGANVGAQQQQLANLMGGYQGAFGTLSNVLGIEQNLIGQAAGLEEARAKAAAGAYASVAGQEGLLSSAVSGFASGYGGGYGKSGGSLSDMF